MYMKYFGFSNIHPIDTEDIQSTRNTKKLEEHFSDNSNFTFIFTNDADNQSNLF